MNYPTKPSNFPISRTTSVNMIMKLHITIFIQHLCLSIHTSATSSMYVLLTAKLFAWMIPLWRLHARLGVRQRPHFGGRRLLQGYVGYHVCWHRFPAQLGRSEDWEMQLSKHKSFCLPNMCGLLNHKLFVTFEGNNERVFEFLECWEPWCTRSGWRGSTRRRQPEKSFRRQSRMRKFKKNKKNKKITFERDLWVWHYQVRRGLALPLLCRSYSVKGHTSPCMI